MSGGVNNFLNINKNINEIVKIDEQTNMIIGRAVSLAMTIYRLIDKNISNNETLNVKLF